MFIIALCSLCFWINSYGMYDCCGNFLKPYNPQEYHAKKLEYAYAGKWAALRRLSTEIQTKKLLDAASKNDLNSVTTIIQKNPYVNVNAYDEEHYFPLLYAVNAENREMVFFLLMHKANVNQLYHARRNGIGPATYYNRYEDRKTALFDAIQNANPGIVFLLLAHKADVKALNGVGQNPLLKALDALHYTQKTFTIVSVLLTYKSDPNIQEDIIIIKNNNGTNRLGGQTALIKAAQKSPEMVKLLIQHGACNTKAQDAQGKTAYDHALEAGFVDTTILLQSISQTKEFPEPKTTTIDDLLSW